MPVLSLKNDVEDEIRVRVASDLKAEAVEIFNGFGLS
jgi:hypothetical protein